MPTHCFAKCMALFIKDAITSLLVMGRQVLKALNAVALVTGMTCLVLLVQDAITHSVVDLRCSNTTKGRQMLSFVGVKCSHSSKRYIIIIIRITCWSVSRFGLAVRR